MALIVRDRILETCSTSGLVDFTLTGAVTGYQRFSAIGNGNTTYYTAYVIGSNDWEVGIGTVGTSSLTRDTILSSSTGSKVNFTGNPVIWCDLPSSKAVFFDANNNISVNSVFEGFTSVSASASLITLTASSTPSYLVTGSGGQTIKLPDATTLPIGTVFNFNNNQSSGAITVNNNSNTLVVSIPSGGYTSVTLTANSNAAGIWDRHDQSPSNVSWSTNTFDYTGSITSATWNGSTVAVNRGGTGLGTTPTNGQLLIGNGTNYSLATLTAGTNIAITNTAGGISIATTGTAAGVDQTDIGTRANQIPLNQYLGTMAWQDAKAVRLGGDAVINTLTVGLGSGQVATNTVLGNGALGGNVSGANLVAIGQQALRVNTTSNNTAVGYQAGYSNTTGFMTAFGYQALYTNTTGGSAYSNTAFGYQTLYKNTTGEGNTAFGGKVADGTSPLYANTTGSYNCAFGVGSLKTNIVGTQNNAVGVQALYNNTGSYNNAFGVNALFTNSSGSNNSAFGEQALYVNTGSNNTAYGYQAGNTLTTGSNNILIGYQAAPSAITVSNEITIGNSSNTVVRMPLNYGAVSALPSASTVGRGSRTFVTDALAPVFQATVTGGGAVFTPVYSDGTNWKVG